MKALKEALASVKAIVEAPGSANTLTNEVERIPANIANKLLIDIQDGLHTYGLVIKDKVSAVKDLVDFLAKHTSAEA